MVNVPRNQARLEYPFSFFKKKGWWTPDEEFVKQWEAYGLTEDDYFHVLEDYPDYWEYHWVWQEPKPKGKVFRKSYMRTAQELKLCGIPEEIILQEQTSRFTQEINNYYFLV